MSYLFKNYTQQRLWLIALSGLGLFAILGNNKNKTEGLGVPAPNHSQGRCSALEYK
jgi:hypothetical protein